MLRWGMGRAEERGRQGRCLVQQRGLGGQEQDKSRVHSRGLWKHGTGVLRGKDIPHSA